MILDNDKTKKALQCSAFFLEGLSVFSAKASTIKCFSSVIFKAAGNEQKP